MIDIDKNQLSVLYKVAKILNENNIEYQISSSMAGKFYGLRRKPDDIDIEVFEKDLAKIEKLFSQYITLPRYHWQDDFYDVDLMECLIDGEAVEFLIIENGFFHSHITGEQIPYINFFKPLKKILKDIEINIQALEAVIGYKKHNLNKEKAANQAEDVLELEKIRESF